VKAIIFIIAFLVFISLRSAAYAVSINVSNFPSSISNDLFNVSFIVTGASDGQNYFRVDLYKEGTSNYFGETYNGSSWYSGSEGKQYFPLSITNSSASATIQARLGNLGSEYVGPGAYKLKIRRYTSSGNASSSDNQTSVDIVINYSSPTLSPTSSPTNTSTPTPSSTLTPTPTNLPTATLTLSPTKKPTNTVTPTVTTSEEKITRNVLGSSQDPTISPKENMIKEATSFNLRNWFGFIFTFIGVIFLSLCGILFFWPAIKAKIIKHEQN